MRAELSSRAPVFVYFTADWCLTCKVNEAAAIDRDEVREAFKQGRRESARRRLDQRRSGDHPLPRKPRPGRRAALPLVCAGQGQPEELPQILTPAMLISRARSATALGARSQTFLPAIQVSSTCVRASDCASTVLSIAVDDDEVGPFAGFERADPVLCEAGISRAAREGMRAPVRSSAAPTESSRPAAGRSCPAG